ncbi:MAG: hypothetical protein ACPGVS_03245 [Primorskyibacter sp.]
MFLRCLLTLCLVALTPPVLADDSQICDRSARNAARDAFVPSHMVLALTYLDAPARRSPWTVHVDGAIKSFATRAAAESFVHTAALAGQTQFLVGCFQVLHIWHGTANPIFDADANARRAVRQLATFRARTRDWADALTRYQARLSDVAAIATVRAFMPDTIQMAGLLHKHPVR